MLHYKFEWKISSYSMNSNGKKVTKWITSKQYVKLQFDHGKRMKEFLEGDLVLWMLKDEKIKQGKFRMPWERPYKVGKVYTNNIIKLKSLGKDNLGTLNVNKLKPFKLPKPTMIMVATVWVIPDYDEFVEPRHASQTKSWRVHKLAMYCHLEPKQKIWGEKQENL